jgi:anaerobic selenocysteine-containing dehydrogenase
MFEAVDVNLGSITITLAPLALAKADHWLQIRPGTDGALALGMLNIVINEGLYDQGFVEKWGVSFDELKERIQEYPPKKVAEITWISEDDIRKIARMYATLKPSCLYIRVAPEMIFNSTQSLRAMAILVAITGALMSREEMWPLAYLPEFSADFFTVTRNGGCPMRSRKSVWEPGSTLFSVDPRRALGSITILHSSRPF